MVIRSGSFLFISIFFFCLYFFTIWVCDPFSNVAGKCLYSPADYTSTKSHPPLIALSADGITIIIIIIIKFKAISGFYKYKII